MSRSYRKHNPSLNRKLRMDEFYRLQDLKHFGSVFVIEYRYNKHYTTVQDFVDGEMNYYRADARRAAAAVRGDIVAYRKAVQVPRMQASARAVCKAMSHHCLKAWRQSWRTDSTLDVEDWDARPYPKLASHSWRCY